ncbi:hypothetical protein BDR26DRAFT_197926 [Obelidium mucronatum]|nr:hypothetical protein BDR26DRAFT_197926 [Obelidium mucronatum]
MVFTLIVHLYTKDDPAVIASVAAKLAEASQIYMKDKGTISWFVMQDHVDKRAFTIVERYDQESIHNANPFFAEFGAHVWPLLDKPVDVRRCFELE